MTTIAITMGNVTSQLVNVTVIKDTMDTPVTVSKLIWDFSLSTEHNFLILFSKELYKRLHPWGM